MRNKQDLSERVLDPLIGLAMKRKSHRVPRGRVLALGALLLWSVGTGAQTNPPAPATNLARLTAAQTAANPDKPTKNDSSVRRVPLTFFLDQIEILRTTTAFGEPLWKYVASLIYIFLAFYISKFLDYLTPVWLKKWTHKTQTQLDDLLLDLLNGPIKVVAFVVFLNV